MKLFVRFRVQKLNTVFTLIIGSIVFYVSFNLTPVLFYKISLFILALLFVVGQLFIIGYKVLGNNSRIISKRIISQSKLSFLYNLSFIEKIICEEKNGVQYYYSEIAILENVYSFYSFLRLKMIKKRVVEKPFC